MTHRRSCHYAFVSPFRLCIPGSGHGFEGISICTVDIMDSAFGIRLFTNKIKQYSETSIKILSLVMKAWKYFSLTRR